MITQYPFVAPAINRSLFKSFTGMSPENGSLKNTKTQVALFTFFRTHPRGNGSTAACVRSSGHEDAITTAYRNDKDPACLYDCRPDDNDGLCALPHSIKYTDQKIFPGYVDYQAASLRDGGSPVIPGMPGA